MVRLSRIGIVAWVMAFFAVALLAKAAHVQLVQGAAWEARAARQQVAGAKVPAPRGEILDASGAPLAQSRPLLQLHVAPREVRDRRALARALARLDVARPWIAQATSTRRAWVTLPGLFLPTDAAPLVAMRGVYAEASAERLYTGTESARRLVGHVNANGDAVDGMELALDTLLRGETGRSTVMRDARGRRFESPAAPGVAPRAGHTVTLTLNRTLQDISERALDDAAREMNADGGDIVVLDPHDGAILAMASRRANRRMSGSPALTEPFEPGSTLKPFIAGALLATGKAGADDVVSTAGGTYTVEGRTITDLHKAESMSLREVIRWSSNVGIARFAERLTRREQYEALRDYGFGTSTGVPYPAEADGTLRPPAAWSKQSPVSMAMGYEVAVTPLQLALAYGAIANGGELLEPGLVREVRDAGGEVTYRHHRRVVRRALPAPTAALLREMLVDVVERGTAVEADLATFAVSGKSGTARRTSGATGYQAGAYTATFVGLFPAERPQFVILVKIDNPRGAYYGGRTAAPVSRAVLQAALAARNAALDRGALASADRSRPRPVESGDGIAEHGERGTPVTGRAAGESALASTHDVAPTEPAPADSAAAGTVAFVVALPTPPAPRAPVLSARPVPDVRGLPIRHAVHTLHRAGFRVLLGGGGSAGGETWPSAGTLTRPGTVVRLNRR